MTPGRRASHLGPERRLRLGQRHPVLGATGAGERRYDGSQVELDLFAVVELHIGLVPQALRLRVRLDQGDVFGGCGR